MSLPDGLAGSSVDTHVVIETLVLDDTLLVQLSNTVTDDAKSVKEYRVSRADGRPLPSWLERSNNALLVGKRPAHV